MAEFEGKVLESRAWSVDNHYTKPVTFSDVTSYGTEFGGKVPKDAKPLTFSGVTSHVRIKIWRKGASKAMGMHRHNTKPLTFSSVTSYGRIWRKGAGK